MFDYMYHMTSKLLKTPICGVKTSIFYHLLHNVIIDVITPRYKICKLLVALSILLHGVISLPAATQCDKCNILAIHVPCIVIFDCGMTYETFFMLDSAEHNFYTALMLKCQQLLVF